MLRRQLPVYSPIQASALLRAFRSALFKDETHYDSLATYLAQTYSARQVTLTDSGTSALVLALRILVGEGRRVAFPAYACVDLAAAALYARVKVVSYDIDPATLSPDLDSISRLLKQDVAAVLVAHLYGFPADVLGVMELARAHEVAVIEDAAQGTGGMLGGRALGSFGALSVLSFNRGKGVTGGGGGALLTIAPDLEERVASTRGRAFSRRGWRDLAVATSQWIFGRPGLYSIPSAVPGLRLGEMVYHPAREPDYLSVTAAALVHAAFQVADREVAVRRANAETLMTAVGNADGLATIRPTQGGTSGYLRFPLRDLRGRAEVPRLGILRGYPRTLVDQPEIRPCLQPNEPIRAGAAELKRTLFTLPVHSRVTPRDLAQLTSWMRLSTDHPLARHSRTERDTNR